MGMISQEVLDAKRRAVVADIAVTPQARRDRFNQAIEDRRVLAVEIDRLMEALLNQQDGKDKLEVEIERLQGRELVREYVKQAEKIERLQAERTRALVKVDGIDYQEGHFRDNTTPDELRDIVLGLALKIERLRAGLQAIADNNSHRYAGWWFRDVAEKLLTAAKVPGKEE